MKKFAAMIVLLSGAALAPAQATRPAVSETRIAELPFGRESTSAPLDLTDCAVRDGRGRCGVHHRPLRAARVPIIYGLVPGPAYDVETEKREFPNALTRYEAGCIVLERKWAKVLHCGACLSARRAREKRAK